MALCLQACFLFCFLNNFCALCAALAHRPVVEPSKKEKFNAAPPPTIAYTADVAMAVAANAADRAKQEVGAAAAAAAAAAACISPCSAERTALHFNIQHLNTHIK
eukprot:1161773-Pelagomonas_calceolata.AAC.6